MTVQERNVQIGCTWLTCSSNLKKINKKIRYQNTESDVCKWHCQYEVENNECEYLTDCEWLISEVMMMLRGWVWVQESDGLGEETTPKSLSLPSGSGSAYQMAAKWKDSYQGDLSLWWFWQLCFCSVWGRCPAERGEQTLRCAQLSAQLSARPCSPDWSCFHTTLRCTLSIHFLWSLRKFSGLMVRPWISSAVADGTVFAWLS